jgi:hypothetical protein
VDVRSSAVVLLAIVCTGLICGAAEPAIATEWRAQGMLDAQLKDYADLFVTLGEQAVRRSRLASPLPWWIAKGIGGSESGVAGLCWARRTILHESDP